MKIIKKIIGMFHNEDRADNKFAEQNPVITKEVIQVSVFNKDELETLKNALQYCLYAGAYELEISERKAKDVMVKVEMHMTYGDQIEALTRRNNHE